MKPFVLIAAAALLLTGCQSKRDTCALWEGDQISEEEAVKRLGLKPDTDWEYVDNYCDFYKS